MLTDLELMTIQARALFTQNARSRLLSINEPDGTAAPAPLLFLGRTAKGNVWRFRADLPEPLVEQLDVLCSEEPPLKLSAPSDLPIHLRRYESLIGQHLPMMETSSGPAYYFAEDISPSAPVVAVTEANSGLLRGGFEDFVPELPRWQPFVALLKDDRAVSICRSVRILPEAHEAGVETLPEFRGRGHAREVVARWAQLVRAAGAIPLYSTSWDNTASQAVARKLRMQFYGTDFHIC